MRRASERSWAALLLAVLLTVLLGGCALHTERIILLPEADGRPTSLVVRQGEREVVLDRPYAATELTRADPWGYSATSAEIDATFGTARAALPARANHYTLYFIEGSGELTAESEPDLEKMFADVAQRPVADIVVVGHTDTVGNDQLNDKLALERAGAIRAALIRRGIAPESIVATGRGKRELLVPTGDSVAEPRNRRVEIIVR
jgi:outer membrane protein OmpA-like peptidoglycan-associated protein